MKPPGTISRNLISLRMVSLGEKSGIDEGFLYPPVDTNPLPAMYTTIAEIIIMPKRAMLTIRVIIGARVGFLGINNGVDIAKMIKVRARTIRIIVPFDEASNSDLQYGQ